MAYLKTDAKAAQTTFDAAAADAAAAVAEINAVVGMLSDRLNVDWSDVGDIEQLQSDLRQITDRLYGRGEYA